MREAAISRLVDAELLVRRGGIPRTTRRLQAALARAAFALLAEGDRDLEDLRVPLARALVELRGHDVPAELLAEEVAALVAVEREELDPRGHLAREGAAANG